MQEIIKPIDVVIGEANDGHAELAEASVRDIAVVNNIYRVRSCAEAYELLCDLCGDSTAGTDVSLLVLLDCGLPQVGGIGTLMAIKRDPRYSWIPIIVMTAAFNRQHAEQIRHLGGEAYVTKWAVFLGLPSFVELFHSLKDGTTQLASPRCTANRSRGGYIATLDAHSVSNVPGQTAMVRAAGAQSNRRAERSND